MIEIKIKPSDKRYIFMIKIEIDSKHSKQN